MPPPALTASAGTSAAAKCWPWPRDLELLPARAGNGAPHALQAPVFAALPFFDTCRSWNVCPLCSSFGSRGLVDKELAAGAGDSRLDSWAALYRAEIAGSASATAPPAICHSSDPPRTRAWNLRLRGPTPYPLGQRTYVHSQALRLLLCARLNSKSLMPMAGTAKAPMRIRAGRRRLVERRPDHSAKHSRAVLGVRITSELRR